MKTSLILKLNFLVLGLFIVIFAIRSLNQGGLPSGVRELFGVSASQDSGPRLKKISWCETRVESLVWPDSFQLAQEGRKWFVTTAEKKELNFIAVEKWFGRYCAVRSQVLPELPEPLETFQPVLFVKFITDKVEALRRSPDGTYWWQGQAFQSEELDLALKELAQLVGVTSQD